MNEPLELQDEPCPTCQGTGVCTVCRGGSIPDVGVPNCECQARHHCVDCLGSGDYSVYATVQMERLRYVLKNKYGFPAGD